MKGRSHRLQSSDPPDDWVNGSWVVDCVCGVNFDDGEEMVNCDECGVWVHTRCSRYVKGDDIFVCDKCKIKNSRNDSEETEVAQLLVELPTKTVRMESSYGPPPNVTTRRPFRLWTDIPMEERVHVQGIPGGDPAIFGGLSSVFTPELWKSTGYVPKKFNFQYREFPCWDEKKEDDARFDEDNDNAVDKGAGVLFSLLKESVLANPVAALVGMRGREENRSYDKKVSLKETKRWDNEVVDHRCAQSGVKKERSVLRPVVLHSGKRKKDDLGTSKDRSGKKKARAAEKEADAKKRGGQSSKSVFTPTSDAKQLEFSEDRGPKISKANKKLSDSVVREPASDVCLAADYTVGKHSSEALISDMSKQKLSIGDDLKEDKIGHQVPAVLGNITISKTDEVVASLSKHNDAGTDCVKEEGDSTADDNLDAKPPDEDLASSAHEVKDQIQYPTDDLSVQPYSKVKTEEHDDNSRNPLNVHGDAKGFGISSDHMSESSKVNDVTVNSPLSSDHNVQGADRTSETVGDSQTDKGDELSGDPCLLKPELEGSGGSMTLQKSSSDPKHGLGIAKEPSESGGTFLNSPAVPSQCKTVACAGKYSTISSTIAISKPSTSGNLKSGDAQNPNPTAKQRVLSESNVNIKKDRASCEDIDEDRDNMPRKTVKEQLRSPTDSSLKTSHSSRNSHDSTSKSTTSESKDLVQHSSSKASPPGNTVVPSVPSEPAGSLPSQKVLHAQNKSSASSASQRGEKLNQTTSSKTNQNHAPSACPPAPSSSHAPLSDEELALLLHQELNSSPRVPRVPRVRHASSLPQLASPSATSMLMKRTTSSGGKDPSSVSRRKVRDASKDGVRGSRELDDEAKRTDRVLSSPDQRRQDTACAADAGTKREDNGSSTVVHSVKKSIHSASTATAHSGPSSSTEANDRNVSSVRSSPRNASDDDTGAVGPVHRTLPGLINEIMSKGKRMTYEELCNAVLPHWHNLRKHNGERYAYTSHSQAVLDCLRNRHEWARLVDRGPKTNSSRKKRKLDAEDSDDNEYGRGKNPKELEGKSIETQREDFPKGKRKARKRRRLALQGRGIKDVREKRKADLLTDDDVGPSFSNSSEGSMSSEDDIQGGGAGPLGSEASSSSDEAGTTC